MQQQMTYQEVLQGLFDALADLKAAVTRHSYSPDYGICGEIDTYWEQAFGEFTFDKVLGCLEGDAPSDLLSDLMELWPEGTGCCAYPIPAMRGYTDTGAARDVFHEQDDRWVGEQLELRLELIDYLLNALSDRLEKVNANSNSN